MNPSVNSPEVNLSDQCWSTIGVFSPNKPSCPQLAQVAHCKNCDVYIRHGRRLFLRKIPESTRSEWTATLARPLQREGLLSDSVLVFRLGDEYFALPTRLFEEVIPMRKVHRIPHRSGKVIKGLVAFRGRLELCVSLGSLLGVDKSVLEPQESHPFDTATFNNLRTLGNAPGRHDLTGNRILVISKDGENRFLFPVSAVHGTYRYNLENLQRVHNQSGGPGLFAYMCGIFTMEGTDKQVSHSVGLVDDTLLFEALNRSLHNR